MKMSVEWHQNNLNAQKEHLSRKIKQRNDLAEEIDRSHASIDFLELQIRTAKYKQKTEFDGDKFCVKRGNT